MIKRNKSETFWKSFNTKSKQFPSFSPAKFVTRTDFSTSCTRLWHLTAGTLDPDNISERTLRNHFPAAGTLSLLLSEGEEVSELSQRRLQHKHEQQDQQTILYPRWWTIITLPTAFLWECGNKHEELLQGVNRLQSLRSSTFNALPSLTLQSLLFDDHSHDITSFWPSWKSKSYILTTPESTHRDLSHSECNYQGCMILYFCWYPICRYFFD